MMTVTMRTMTVMVTFIGASSEELMMTRMMTVMIRMMTVMIRMMTVMITIIVASFALPMLPNATFAM